MTLTDEALVRDLSERAALAAPTMSLDPAAVLAAGHRHRRRRTVRGASVGALAVAAVAVAAVQLTAEPGPVAVPAAQTVELVEGLTATVPTEPKVVETVLGTGVDLGLPADDEHSYVVLKNDGGLEVQRIEADGTFAEEPYLSGGYTLSFHYVDTSGDTTTLLGQVAVDTEVTLISSLDDGSAPLTVPIPTAEVPDLPGAVYMLRIDGAPADGVWPHLSVELRLADGTTTSQLIDLPAEPADGSPITVSVADDVQPIETDDGPGWDLGIQTGDGWDPLGEDLTYALRVGALLDGDASTPDEPGLWLVTLASDGSTVTGAGGSVDEALAPTSRSPLVYWGLADHECFVVGVRPPALAGATFAVVVSTADGEERTAIPTFRLADLDADVWFVALTDDEATHSDWNTVMIVATMADGSTAMWNLAGQEVMEALPETPTGDASDG